LGLLQGPWHAGACKAFLIAYEIRGVGEDDRQFSKIVRWSPRFDRRATPCEPNCKARRDPPSFWNPPPNEPSWWKDSGCLVAVALLVLAAAPCLRSFVMGTRKSPVALEVHHRADRKYWSSLHETLTDGRKRSGLSVQRVTQQRLFLAVWEFGDCAPAGYRSTFCAQVATAELNVSRSTRCMAGWLGFLTLTQRSRRPPR